LRLIFTYLNITLYIKKNYANYLTDATKEPKPCFADFQHEQNSKSDVYNKKAKIGWKKANESQVRFLVTFLKEKIALFSVVRCTCSAKTLRGYVFFLMVIS